ncbi:hypothetical protein MTO96_019814 [Rhipicephalus appendiculatus]
MKLRATESPCKPPIAAALPPRDTEHLDVAGSPRRSTVSVRARRETWRGVPDALAPPPLYTRRRGSTSGGSLGCAIGAPTGSRLPCRRGRATRTPPRQVYKSVFQVQPRVNLIPPLPYVSVGSTLSPDRAPCSGEVPRLLGPPRAANQPSCIRTH